MLQISISQLTVFGMTPPVLEPRPTIFEENTIPITPPMLLISNLNMYEEQKPFCQGQVLWLLDATFSNILVLSWDRFHLDGKCASNWHTISHKVVSNTPLDGRRPHSKTLVVRDTVYKDRCRSNYHGIKATVAHQMGSTMRS